MSGLEHVDDYPEIPVSLASTRTAIKTGQWRSVRPLIQERAAPCSAGCPAGIGLPSYASDIKAGRLDEAFAAITARNPFPRITGRVCPHSCEDRCNLTLATGEEAVSIRAVERWLGDATAHVAHPLPEVESGKRVAIVGSGPAGLSAAFYLRRSGHDVTVLDRRVEAGGLLRYGIPEYRLPQSVVDDEVARLLKMGIDFQLGVELGSDVTLESLEEFYSAVFIATGAARNRAVGVRGESLLEPGLAFLDAANSGRAVLPGRRCAVVGGGNTAMDVARVLNKLGAEVTVLYRRTGAEMPAIREEYEHAVSDGVRFEWLVQPLAVHKEGAELVVVVEDMQLGEPDHTGRPRPVPTGSQRALRFDAVFSAIGEVADTSLFPRKMLDEAGWVSVDESGATQLSHVFAGGDLASGPSTVIEAVVAGRRAARAIDVQLGFGHMWPTDDVLEVVGAEDVNPANLPRFLRASAHRTHATGLAEESATLSEAEALVEVERCLSCGHCSACGTCFVFCPDGAMTWDDGPVFDYEFCKGCGICVAECPGHAVILVHEREPVHA